MQELSDLGLKLGGVVLRLELVVELDEVLRHFPGLGEIHHPPFTVGKRHAFNARLLSRLLNEEILDFANLHAPDCKPRYGSQQQKIAPLRPPCSGLGALCVKSLPCRSKLSVAPMVGERAKIVLCGYPIPCNFGKAG